MAIIILPDAETATLFCMMRGISGKETLAEELFIELCCIFLPKGGDKVGFFRLRVRASLRYAETGRRGRPRFQGAGEGKCDSGFAYHRRKPAFSYIVDCKWLVSA